MLRIGMTSKNRSETKDSMDEFVIGFLSDDPDGLTPIEVVMDITGLSYEEVKSCCEVIKFPDEEPEI